MTTGKLPGGTAAEPVFVLSAPRSFSSLVNAMIGQHPELYGVPELNLFQCETVAEFNSGRVGGAQHKSPFWATMRHGLLRLIAQTYTGEQTLESIRMAERWLRTREDLETTDIFHELHDRIAPLRIVEKSPGIIRRLDFMKRMYRAFPDAKFIHLVRNPISQAQSVLNAKGGVGVLMAMDSIDHTGDRAVLEPQILWHDTQVQILRFLDMLPDDQFVTIRGEEFLSNLDESLPSLCRWLGVSDDAEAVNEMRHPENSPFSTMGPANAPLGNDVNFLKRPALREGNVKVPGLSGPVPWRDDGTELHPEVISLARALGY